MKTQTVRGITVAFAASLFASSLTATAAPFDTIETQAATPLAGFEKVYIAPVSVELPERTRRNFRDNVNDRPVRESDQVRKAEDAHKDLVRAFERKNFAVVDAPGADVLTVETTITSLRSSRPTLADYDVQVGLDFNSVYAGGADFDIRLSQEDTVLVEIEEDFRTRLDDGRPRVGIWQDVDRATQRVATRLAKYVTKN